MCTLDMLACQNDFTSLFENMETVWLPLKLNDTGLTVCLSIDLRVDYATPTSIFFFPTVRGLDSLLVYRLTGQRTI